MKIKSFDSRIFAFFKLINKGHAAPRKLCAQFSNCPKGKSLFLILKLIE